MREPMHSAPVCRRLRRSADDDETECSRRAKREDFLKNSTILYYQTLTLLQTGLLAFITVRWQKSNDECQSRVTGIVTFGKKSHKPRHVFFSREGAKKRQKRKQHREILAKIIPCTPFKHKGFFNIFLAASWFRASWF